MVQRRVRVFSSIIFAFRYKSHTFPDLRIEVDKEMEEQLRLLREKLAGLRAGDSEPVGQPKEKVIDPLTLEGVASHIQKIKNSDDSM